MNAPARVARPISRLTKGRMSSPPRTYRLPVGSAKSCWTSVTINAVLSSNATVATSGPIRSVPVRREKPHEPRLRVVGGALQGPRLLEQMRRARDDDQVHLRGHSPHRLAIQLKNL